MTLLQRLATVGFGRREEPQHGAPDPGHAQRHRRRPAPSAVRGPCGIRQAAAPLRRATVRPRVSSTRRAPRAGTAAVEDDQLEIPAFLRRQAN